MSGSSLLRLRGRKVPTFQALNPLADLGGSDPTTGSPPDNALLGPPVAQAPTLADAWSYNSKAAGDWIAQQRADSVAKGFLDPNTGWPTQAGLVDAAQQYGSALVGGTETPGKMPSGLVDVLGTTAHINPTSRADIARMMEAAPYHHLRVLTEGPNEAIWPAYDATHKQMVAPLGFTKNATYGDFFGQVGPPDDAFTNQFGRFSVMATSH